MAQGQNQISAFDYALSNPLELLKLYDENEPFFEEHWKTFLVHAENIALDTIEALKFDSRIERLAGIATNLKPYVVALTHVEALWMDYGKLVGHEITRSVAQVLTHRLVFALQKEASRALDREMGIRHE